MGNIVVAPEKLAGGLVGIASFSNIKYRNELARNVSNYQSSFTFSYPTLPVGLFFNVIV